MADQLKPVIVVLGMDRSGTSLCTDILSFLGVNLSDDLYPAQEANPRGYFESKVINHLHEELLAVLGTSWSTPDIVKPLPPVWWRLPSVQPIYKKLLEFVREETQTKQVMWGYKDPRTARLLPLWKEIFCQIGLSPRYILAVRNPLAVIQSLHKRDGLSAQHSEILWLERNLQALCYARNVTIIHYEDWFINPMEVAKRLIDDLALPWSGDDTDLEAMLRQVIIPEYKHDIAEENRKFHISLTDKLYRVLRAEKVQEIMDMARYGRQVLAISQDISVFALQKPREYIAKLEGSITTLNTTIAERERYIGQLHQEDSQKLARITELESSISNLTNQNAECDKRIAHLTQESSNKDVQIAELQATVTNLNGQIAERDKRIAEYSGSNTGSAL